MSTEDNSRSADLNLNLDSQAPETAAPHSQFIIEIRRPVYNQVYQSNRKNLNLHLPRAVLVA